MPSDMATDREEDIEEERRLLYVAMTRAKHHLDLITPQRFYVRQQRRGGDSYINATLTRFIPGKVARPFEQVTPFSAQVDRRVQTISSTVDGGAKLRAMSDLASSVSEWRANRVGGVHSNIAIAITILIAIASSHA